MSSGISMSSHCLRVVLLFLVLSLVIKSTDAYVFEVGGLQGWTNWDQDTEGVPDYNAWASGQGIEVGDSIVFSYAPGFHTVMRFNSERAYNTCDFTQATQLDDGSSGTYVWHPTSGGVFFFACDQSVESTGTHCTQGQKVAITVLANSAVSPYLSPAPGIPAPESPAPPQGSPSKPPSISAPLREPTSSPATSPSAFVPASPPTHIPAVPPVGPPSVGVPVAPPTDSPLSVPASPPSIPIAPPTGTPASAPSDTPNGSPAASPASTPPSPPEVAVPVAPPTLAPVSAPAGSPRSAAPANPLPSTSPGAAESPPPPQNIILSPALSPYFNGAGPAARISCRWMFAVAALLIAHIA